MTHSLLFRPIPYADESAASLLIRAAEENGHKNVYQLLVGRGIQINEPSLKACVVDRPRYRSIIKALGLVDDAAELALSRVSTSRRAPRRYRSIAIPDVCFRREDACAFCAECLLEAPYWRQQWLLRPFAACAKHQRLLVDHCLHCGRIPAIGRGVLTRCNHCGSSLLEMTGNLVCVDSMVLVQHMLDTNNIDLLGMVWEFWEALLHFDGKDSRPTTEQIRLDSSVSFALDDIKAETNVASLVRERLSSLHPRIQLLPFLTGSFALTKFAEKISDMIPPLPKIGTGLPQCSKLSKSEVCRIFGISAAKLADMIESGDLLWPDSGGRQRKIPIAYIELMLHGFSIAERKIASTELISHFVHPDVANLPNMGAFSGYAASDDETNDVPRLTWESFWRGTM